MLTDTHCHIYKEYYDDIDKILNESIKNGVNRWINNGCDKNSNKEILDYSFKYPNMYIALGIHPECVSNYDDKDLVFIEKNISNKKVIAIGEIGLDYHYSEDNKEEQILLLESQLKLASKYNLPVIIHSRDANKDIIEILKKYNLKGVIHSFSGNIKEAKEFIKMGYLIGINGIITFKNSNIKELLNDISLDNILLETDSPYLAPVPYRGQQNSPKHIKDIAEFIVLYNKITMEELEVILNNNIKKLFNI